MSAAVETIGMVAASLTTLAYLPQSIRTIKTRSTGDLSLKMLALLATGLVLWVVYGAFLGSLPLIAANIVTLALIAPILYHKLASMKGKGRAP
ncbi:MAG: SemiSWEET transporter [Alphaproteobacteria bacterium]